MVYCRRKAGLLSTGPGLCPVGVGHRKPPDREVLGGLSLFFQGECWYSSLACVTSMSNTAQTDKGWLFRKVKSFSAPDAWCPSALCPLLRISLFGHQLQTCQTLALLALPEPWTQLILGQVMCQSRNVGIIDMLRSLSSIPLKVPALRGRQDEWGKCPCNPSPSTQTPRPFVR